MDRKKHNSTFTDSDDDKSLMDFIKIKKDDETRTVIKKLHVVKMQNPDLKSENAFKKRVRGKKKQYKCSDCERGGVTRIFKLKSSLETHITSKHGEDWKKFVFVCDVCDADQKPPLFGAKKQFLAHMMMQHSMVVFICDICTAIFKLKANYKTHLATHNLKPKREYKCDVCNGSFVNKAGYVAHRKRFPGPHIKQICPHCGTSFSREKHMQNHRCKTLMLKEAKVKASQERIQQPTENIASASTNRQIIIQPGTASNQISVQELHEVPQSDQLVIRDLTGQIVPGAQVLHFEIDEQTPQVYQVNVADWNMVAPYVIREQVPTIQVEPAASE